MQWRVSEITKLEAAGRQLDQAIRLVFECGDLLAVHTLTGAAFQLFADLGKEAGIISRVRSEELVKPEGMRKWINALNSTQNFLKHADKDPGEVLKYVEEGTLLFIYEALELAQRMGVLDSDERLAYKIWFAFSFPDLIQPAVLERLRAANPTGLDQTDRSLWAEWLRTRALTRRCS